MTDTARGQSGVPRRRSYQWIYLASLLFAGVANALLNAPSGYAPFLCGTTYRDVPCVGYTWVDGWPQWLTAALWFIPIALNIAALVLLFEVGSIAELKRTTWWLLGVIAVGVAYVLVHHWKLVVVDRGPIIDDGPLHRWNVLGLIHYGFEYAVIPLALIGLLFTAPTWWIRARRERQLHQQESATL
jgi:hypothetical protein